ncbi:MAG: hypothetical protein H0X70_08590 [Segetibacter sp.]|nr:hypothetical protein [Segetibacter sp.]
MIAVNQDSLGIQTMKYSSKDSLETWIKPLKNGDWAICFLNRKSATQPVNFYWSAQVIEDAVAQKNLDAKAAVYKLRNLWTKKDAGNTKKALQLTVEPHDVVMLRLSR